ncbi:MAG: FAD-dependent oxidoreductase [Acidobacteriota bacterium]|nr:FAD-dependent oxidoreductase [Acidobacteriota bacterium]
MAPLDLDATVAVVGSGLAGLRAAEKLRAQGHRGPLVLLGAEHHVPYDRPPLSKQLLAGTWGLDRVVLRTKEKLEALSLDMRLGCRATALDLEGRRLELDDGGTLGFDGLVLATGAEPRALPGTGEVAGVHLLRTLDDCAALATATADPATRLVVIGAGFIGSEVAATCHGRGLEVTVLEALPVPLERALGARMGAACAALHGAHGVALRTGTAVSGLAVEEGGVRGVELAEGSVVPADVVLVGIGVAPATGWLEGSGLELRDGVVSDATLHAADGVVVAGDLARWRDEAAGTDRRIEHWTNAAEQGMHAARSLLAGREAAEAYRPVPYFWSDQYDVKIQMLGTPSPDDDVEVVDGSVDEERFVAVYGRAGTLTGAIAFSRPRQLMGFRPLLEGGASFEEALALLAS